jgi:hypothetical protein
MSNGNVHIIMPYRLIKAPHSHCMEISMFMPDPPCPKHPA